LDTHIPGICTDIDIAENEFSEVKINVFPNPFSNTFSLNYNIPEKSKIKMELINLIGEQVSVYFDGYKPEGSYREEISAAGIASGIYFVKLSINDQVAYKKIVKLAID
jgi:hypothetical protein